MSAYLLPGILGLLLGLTLFWTGFSQPGALRDTLALRRNWCLRSGLYALGWSMALTTFLCWLAVIDVDTIEVLPLSAGTLIGGAIFGIAAGLSGFTPGTAFAGLGSGAALEALSAIAGGLLAALLLPALEGPLSALHALPPSSAATLFEVTLDEPFLLGGGFLGQGCAGLLLMVIAVCIPSPKPTLITDVTPAAEEPAPEEAAPVPEPDPPGEPELPRLLPAAAPEETFVALLPGEEPLVVDTALDEDAEESDDESAESDPSATPPPEDEAVPDASGEEATAGTDSSKVPDLTSGD